MGEGIGRRLVKAPLGACIDRLRVCVYVRTPEFGELVRETRETCLFVCLSVVTVSYINLNFKNTTFYVS